ncbi:MAG TPA: alkaline phosphatase family protein, partial [Polyangiaceae bacterium]
MNGAWLSALARSSLVAAATLSCSSSHPSVAATPEAGPTCRVDGGAEASRDACSFHAGALAADTFDTCAKIGDAMPIQHIVVLMMENRSFDHYFGHLPGNGQDDVDVATPDASNPSAIDGEAAIPWHHADSLCFFDTNHEW